MEGLESFNTGVLTDRELVVGGVLDLVEENRASARRWARLVEIHRRAPEPAATAVPGWGSLSAREWAASQTGEMWALGDNFLRSQINVALFLAEHMPEVWAMCLTGALDRFRAVTVADLLRHRLSDPTHWATVGKRILAFLRKHTRTYAEINTEMVTCTITQLRNRVNYEVRKLVPADEEFQKAFADRGVTVREAEDGIAVLSVTSSTDQVKLARHRLHLSAKELRNAGDERTVEQLMSDLALDLIVGRADGLPVPQYARPIINVTVPLETLAGLADDPGQLNGGGVIPADLARAVAQREGATWYRLLTDPAGDPVVLSTKSYQPTDAIWRYVVATQQTCAHKGCDRPAVECDLDHDEAWPEGPTDTVNLVPRCRRHHKAKHARAERPDLEWEYFWAS